MQNEREKEYENNLYRTYGSSSKEVEAYHQQQYKKNRETDESHPLYGMNSTSITPDKSWTREELEACATCFPEYRTFPIEDQKKAEKILVEKYGSDWRFNKPIKHYASMAEYDTAHPGWREKNAKDIEKGEKELARIREELKYK